MTSTIDTDLVERARDEADLCRAETATDVAELLDELASALTAAQARIAELEDKRKALLFSQALDRNEIDTAKNRLATAERERDEARRCLGFFASVIKSGEPWTATCQRDYDNALSSAVLGGDQTGATPAGWDERLSSLTTLVYPTPSPSEERYRQALKEIASADHIDLALDPTWPQRIADAALSPTQPEGGETP